MKKLAIVGSGISGLSAAYLLNQKFDITMYEANSTLGGHTNTVLTPENVAVDTGFIVFNEKNFPNFCNFIDQLGVESIESDMSFAYFDRLKNRGYSSDFPSGLFSTRGHLLSPSFYHFLYQITRFNKIAKAEIRNMDHTMTILDFLKKHGFSQRLIDEYVIPMGAAIWSTSQNDTYQFPAKSFISFWENHCLLQILDRPKWRTIAGGSKKYIDALIKKINLNYFVNHPIYNIKRESNNVILYGPNGAQDMYDGVVIATHADQALNMIESPTQLEQSTLGKWQYSKNHTTLHTSTKGLPANQSGWASWIYTRENDNTMSATYWMNRLQSLPSNTHHFVTLNPTHDIPKKNQLYTTLNEHPMMTQPAISTQRDLPKLNGINNTYFCGSYFGHGFHEDGISAAVEVGKALGCYL